MDMTNEELDFTKVHRNMVKYTKLAGKGKGLTEEQFLEFYNAYCELYDLLCEYMNAYNRECADYEQTINELYEEKQKLKEVLKDVIKENEELSFDIDDKIKLIDTLQKENEELKDSREVLSKEILSDKATIVLFKEKIDELQKDSISKDKIRDKIKELEEEYEEYKGGQEWEMQDYLETQINLLKELLEE